MLDKYSTTEPYLSLHLAAFFKEQFEWDPPIHLKSILNPGDFRARIIDFPSSIPLEEIVVGY
jgi:hypothetical protein